MFDGAKPRDLRFHGIFLEVFIHGTSRSSLAKKGAQQLCAFLCQLSAGYYHLMIQPRVIQYLQNRADGPRLGVCGCVDQAAKPGVNHRPRTHGAGFQGDEKFAAGEAIVAQGTGCFA